MTLVDFNKESDLNDWVVVDDVVMGGRSDGTFELNQNGHAVFKGQVSLENNGGFSSVRYRSDRKDIDGFSKAVLYIKGDGKNYQFRIKSKRFDRHSYINNIETNGDWQRIEIELSEMGPGFRGRKLAMPNYPAKTLEEVAILISNKKAERFQLEIDKITLE